MEPELHKSAGGVFEVSVNGVSVYSKKDTGRFPDEDKVMEDVKKLLLG